MPQSSYDEAQRTFFARMQETQWLSQRDLEANQRLQLKDIISHAARTSPFYKDRLAPLLRNGSGFDEDRWQAIPILKRSDMHDHQHEMFSSDIPAQDGPVLQYATSGSTGVPVQIKWTTLSAAVRQAALWRMYLWHNFDFAQTFAFAKDAAPWPEGSVEGVWGPPWLASPLGQRIAIPQATPVPRLTEWLHRKKARYFTGLTLLMPAIAEEAQKQGLRLDLACSTGFGMRASAADRAKVKDLLGIPLIETYSSYECGHIAHECAEGTLHILSDLVRVEIVDEDDNPCPPGVEGRVIVTVLSNYAQPVIRYDQGDIAAFAGPCACGRTLPAMTPISGRLRHMFEFDGGKRFAPGDVKAYAILKPHLDPMWYQIAQTGPKSIEIRFVTKIQPPEGYESAIRAAMPSFLQRSDIAVTFRRFNSIPTPLGKKHIMFVNEHANEPATRA